MLQFLEKLWKHKEEILPPPPRPVFPEASGEQLLYKMKYDGTDVEKNRQRNLIRFRIAIKRLVKEIEITKEEHRHWQRGIKPVKTGTEKPIFKNSLFEKPIVENLHSLAMNQRCHFLAYGYLRKKFYSEIETKPRWRNEFPDRPKPDWNRVAELIFHYGNFNEFLLTPREIEDAKKEQLDLLRKWVGN